MLKKIVLTIVALLFFGLKPFIKAQNVQLDPPKIKNNENAWVYKLLIKPEKNILFDFHQNLDGFDAFLKIGSIPNNYSLFQIPLSGSEIVINPQITGLSPGRYYARITNSSENSTSGILADSREDLIYSNEVLVIIEAQSAPTVFSPRGEITDATPVFEWEDIPGVKAYWIIFSSTPFEIINDENDGLSVEGANLVWQYITSENSAVYGEINENIEGSFEAPPLDPGTEYSYAILNLYEKDNPAFASAVFGGIIPMTYSTQNPVPKTTLISPENNEEFYGDQIITFEWTEVPEAVYYRLNLFEKVTQQGVDATIPIYTTTTSNTIIDYPAASNLKNSEYFWNVVTHDDFGGGSTSGTAEMPNQRFQYQIPSGEIVFRAKSAEDNTPLQGVEIRARAINGGITPTAPFLLQASNVTEDFVTGTYEFEASLTGYQTKKMVETIEENESLNVTFELEALPSFVNGVVKDQTGNGVYGAEVSLSNSENNENFITTTSLNGEFFIHAPAGNFQMKVHKEGYAATEEQNISLVSGLQISLEDIIINYDMAEVSGYILSSSGSPIQLATVRASNGDQEIIKVTNSDGFYNFMLSSGNWTFAVYRNGFVTDEPKQIMLSTGDNIQNNNFVLTGGANQVTGFVREAITNSDGTNSYSVLSNATVVATPVSGVGESTLTSINGQFTLNLGSGAYTIHAEKEGYFIESTIHVSLSFAETLSNLELIMEPTQSTISGFVTLPDGTELEDVDVSIPGVVSTQTSINGDFTVRATAGSYMLQASKTGFLSNTPLNISLDDGQNLTGIHFQLTPNAATISGRVLSDGLPVANALITTADSSYTTNSDKQGYYELNVLPGTFQIEARKNGFLNSEPIELTLASGQQLNDRNLLMTRNTVLLNGTVSSSSTVLRNAKVTVSSLEQSGFHGSTFTLATGNYSFSLPIGDSYQIEVSKSGYTPKTFQIPAIEATEDVYVLNILMTEKSASVSGEVTNTDGKKLSNVEVQAINENGEIVFSMTTVGDGRFEVGVNQGEYKIRLSKDGYYLNSFDVTVGLGQNYEDISIILYANYTTMIGELTSASTSEPIENVLVSIQRNDGGTSATRTTSADGRFSFDKMTKGVYDIQFERSGYATEMFNDYSVENGQQILLPVELTPLEGEISGNVVDEEGNSVLNATIYAQATTGELLTTLTDMSGSFELKSLEYDTYTIYANAVGYASSESVIVDVSSNNPVIDINQLPISRNKGIVRGQLTDAGTGANIRQASVSMIGSNGAGNAQTDNNGSFEISNLSPGIYHIEVVKEGYESFIIEDFEIVAGQQIQTVDISLTSNKGSIIGKVTDQNGQPLSSIISVNAKSGSLRYTVETNSTGDFYIDNVETGRTYTIETNAYGQGVQNSSISVDYPKGQTSLEIQDLIVVLHNSVITGNAGIYGAELRLLDSNNGQIISVKNSSPDGSFFFGSLPEGDYQLEITKMGYTFSSDSETVISLSNGETYVVNFFPTSNTGFVRVFATEFNGSPSSGTKIRIVSTDVETIRNATTDSNGEAVFSELPGNKNYIIRATRSEYESSPEFIDTFVSSGDEQEVYFEMIPFASSISGKIVNAESGEPVDRVLIRATHIKSNTYHELSSISDGTYQFDDLRSGTYSMLARRSGYFRATIDSLELEPFQDITNLDFSLTPRVQPRLEYFEGYVFYKGEGVEGAQITIEGDSNYNITTNKDGRYRINNFPVRPTGETIVSVTMNYDGITQNQVHILTSDLIGGSYTTDDFILPSGQIQMVITDGLEPLEGIQANIRRSGSSNFLSFISNADGMTTTDANLSAGDYKITITTPDFLLPQQSYSVNLETDTTRAVMNIELPYSFSPPDSLLASEDTFLNIQMTEGYDVGNTTGTLFYKRETQGTFKEVPMEFENGSLTGKVEAQFTLEKLILYVQVSDAGQPMIFTSPEITLSPLATDLISSITLDPAINGSTLRAGDTYTFTVTVRDGENNNMTERFLGDEGGLEVSVTDSSPLLVSIAGNKIRVTTPEEMSGPGSLTIRARLDPQLFVQTMNMQIVNTPIKELSLNRPSQRISNDVPSSFSYTAKNENGTRILLGEKLEWSLSIDDVGSFTSQGRFTPNSSVITEFQGRITDLKTGLSAESEPVTLYATIREGNNYSLTDADGLNLSISSDAIAGPAEISLRYAKPEKPKKYVFAEGTGQSLTAAERIYRIKYSGEPLRDQVKLSLPKHESLELFRGEKHIAKFDQQSLQWVLYPTKKSSTGFETDQISSFGQFAVLTENLPLSLDKITILPNPFSPNIEPGVKIGYMLSSDAPPAIVTIQIFNMRGQLVRRLLTDNEQLPDRYGSRSSPLEITWDGYTDYGTLASNGRYILRINVRDGKSEMEFFEKIVLIK